MRCTNVVPRKSVRVYLEIESALAVKIINPHLNIAAYILSISLAC